MSEPTLDNGSGVTATSAEAERRAFVERVHAENEEHFGPPARRAVETMLSAGHPHPWAYVYELTQNARDAGARRISWRSNGGSLLFQHDGDTALNQSHVRGLASLGASTKGPAAIGFMGVGFKSVFERFRTARISGFGWRVRFDIRTHVGEFGAKVVEWFDALLPNWDTEPLDPDAGYTTVFLLDRPAVPAARLTEDLSRLATPDDLTPLSVLALRGLEEVCIDDVTWYLSVEDGVVEVRRSRDGLSRRWRFFRSCYRPDDEAMRRLLEVRRELTDQAASGTQRPDRSVVALVPLGKDGLPNPPDQGGVYATLPTRVRVPFGFHLQADWFVNLDRENLRAITGDPWQEAIVQQVPKLVRDVLLWLKEESDPARRRGYRILCDPTDAEGEFSNALRALRCDFVRSLKDLKIVPTHGPGTRRFSEPQNVVRLPGRFLTDFGKRPAWRPDLLFECDLMDEGLLGNRAGQFARWLGWGRDIDPDGVRWTLTLPHWWSKVASDERAEALFALWSCIDERQWHDAPVVPTEAGGWLPAGDTRWLNEEPPSPKEPSGAVVADALVPFLPSPEQRLPSTIRASVNRTSHLGVTWLKARRREERLASIVQRACADAEHGEDFPLVELLDWALARGPQRQDLVPLVLTEDGPHEPSAALLADPVVPGGKDRRRLFPKLPTVVEDYAIIDDQQAVVRFLERLGVCGNATLEEHRVHVGHDPRAVAARLGLESYQIRSANRAGWVVLDYDFPFRVPTVPLDALQVWLSREHTLLAHKGKRKATSSYYGPQTTTGERPSSWVTALEEHPWLLCQDEQCRRPGDVLLDRDLDFEDAPIADIDRDLANRLEQEGVRFGVNISPSPVLRRLEIRGPLGLPDDDLAELLEEAQAEVEAGAVSPEELTAALRSATVRGVPILDRLVREAGHGTRSDLGGWVVALSSVAQDLAAALDRIEIDVPRTTTGDQALAYLSDIWKRKPGSVDAIRTHVASAYRYVLEDIEHDDLDSGAWRHAKREVRLYGKGRWHGISDALVVADVRSPFIRQLLPDNRIAVTSAHLGDTQGQIRLVADELGIALLSTEIKLSRGSQLAEPPWMRNLETLAASLATLEGRSPLSRITSREGLALRIQGESCPVRAYLDEGELMVAGDPAAFGAEAAGQLVEHFQLGQRGNTVPWLTAAIYSLAEDEAFAVNLQVLASGLGLSLPELPTHNPEPDAGGALLLTDGDRPKTNGNEISPGSQIGPREDGSGQGESAADQVTEAKAPTSDSRQAADQFGILVSRRSASERSRPPSPSKPVKPKDDQKARAAVVEYEEHHERRAKEMPPGQPGFDVLSCDRVTGRQRRIEVKGVQGDFTQDASVVLTARQVQDALHHEEGDVDYWLYVVDRTETDDPRVFPIPWTRQPNRLRYGFRADMWAKYAESGLVTSRMMIDPESCTSAESRSRATLRTHAGMDGRGRFLDNIFIKRLWRSLKYEAVYLYELRDGLDAERIIGSWIDFYNEVRPHSSLRGRTPGEAYREGAEVW